MTFSRKIEYLLYNIHVIIINNMNILFRFYSALFSFPSHQLAYCPLWCLWWGYFLCAFRTTLKLYVKWCMPPTQVWYYFSIFPIYYVLFVSFHYHGKFETSKVKKNVVLYRSVLPVVTETYVSFILLMKRM